MLFSDIIIIILRHIYPNISLFLVNKTFNKICKFVYYDSKLFQIACYEGHKDMIKELLNDSNIDYLKIWIIHNCHVHCRDLLDDSINIYQKMTLKVNFDEFLNSINTGWIRDIFYLSESISHYSPKDKYFSFGLNFIEVFKFYQDKFIITNNDKNNIIYKYKDYEIRYMCNDILLIYNTYKYNIISIIDYKNNNFLCLGRFGYYFELVCNTFYEQRSDISRDMYSMDNYNVQNILNTIEKVYKYVINNPVKSYETKLAIDFFKPQLIY
jgi:hypothetical protein